VLKVLDAFRVDAIMPLDVTLTKSFPLVLMMLAPLPLASTPENAHTLPRIAQPLYPKTFLSANDHTVSPSEELANSFPMIAPKTTTPRGSITHLARLLIAMINRRNALSTTMSASASLLW